MNNALRLLAVITTSSALLLAALLVGWSEQDVYAQQGDASTPTTEPTIEPHNEQVPPQQGKINPPKYDRMDYHLNEVVRQYETGALTARAAAARAPIHREDSVAVTFHIEEAHLRDVWDYLISHDIPAREPLDDEFYIEAEVPVSLLAEASRLPGVIVVKPIVPPRPAQFSTGGQGAAAHGARTWHSAGYDGSGTKVGIIDAGFRGFRALQGTELPSSVQAMCYTSSSISSNLLSDCNGLGEHGTALAEIVHETAPGASMYIARVFSQGTLRSAVSWMTSHGVDAIALSTHWLWDGPGNGTSPYPSSPLNSVNRAVSGGSLIAIAAGNETYSSWFGSFSDPDNDENLDFSAGDECNSVTLQAGQTHVTQLRWQGAWLTAGTDLDIYLHDQSSEDMSVVASSENTQDGSPGHNPFEKIIYIPPTSGSYCLSVKHQDGDEPTWVQLQTFTGEALERRTLSHAIGNPAETKNSGALTTGAAAYLDTSAYFLRSSRGPLPDGTIKPDLMGVSGVPSAAYGSSPIGSSFAAPHITGLAALVKQRFPSYTPAQIASYLKSNALARGTKPNNIWGHGFARLPAIATPVTLSDDATLSALTLSDVDFGTFSPDTESYTASVAYSVSQTTVAPTVNDSEAAYFIEFEGEDVENGIVTLAVGENVITIEVVAEDEIAKKTYTVTVTRAAASTDATLSDLTLSDVDFGIFSSATESYTASVPNTVTQTTSHSNREPRKGQLYHQGSDGLLRTTTGPLPSRWAATSSQIEVTCRGRDHHQNLHRDRDARCASVNGRNTERPNLERH